MTLRSHLFNIYLAFIFQKLLSLDLTKVVLLFWKIVFIFLLLQFFKRIFIKNVHRETVFDTCTFSTKNYTRMIYHSTTITTTEKSFESFTLQDRIKSERKDISDTYNHPPTITYSYLRSTGKKSATIISHNIWANCLFLGGKQKEIPITFDTIEFHVCMGYTGERAHTRVWPSRVGRRGRERLREERWRWGRLPLSTP